MLRSLTVFILLSAFTLSAADFNKSVANGRLIYGDKVSSSDLKGKVILLEYWGLN